MKKWAFLTVAAAVALSGCGGSGGGDNGGGGGGGPVDNFAVNTALLNKPGLVQITYNTGQGRGTGATTAVLRQFAIFDSFGQINPLLPPEMFLQLDGFTSQNVDLNASMGGFSTNLNGRSFDTFRLNINSVIQDGSTFSGTGGAPLFQFDFPMRARSLPGRTTSMQVFLNDAMIVPDGSGGLDFDQTEFETVNFDPTEDQIVGFLSDYIAFDISNVSDKPTMLDSSDADWVAFSGDSIALAKAPSTAPDAFEVLVPLGPDPGALEGLWQTAPSFPTNAPGTYTLRQIDPRSLPATSRITSLQGTWRPWLNTDEPSQSPFVNPTEFVFIMFPQSQENGIVDLVCFTHSGGAVDEMYFGEANLNSNTFSCWPISQVDDGDASNEVAGTLGSYVYRSGIGSPVPADIRSGNFNFTSGSRPGSFPATGRFIVYRL